MRSNRSALFVLFLVVSACAENAKRGETQVVAAGESVHELGIHQYGITKASDSEVVDLLGRDGKSLGTLRIESTTARRFLSLDFAGQTTVHEDINRGPVALPYPGVLGSVVAVFSDAPVADVLAGRGVTFQSLPAGLIEDVPYNVPTYNRSGTSTCNCTFGANGTLQCTQGKGWAFCSETATTAYNGKNRWYEEIAGLWVASGCTGTTGCNKNTRVCVRNSDGGVAAGEFVPETGGTTGPQGCSFIFSTLYNCGTSSTGTCCPNSSDCPAPQLSVTVTGQGTVTSKPAGINCSSGTCSTRFGGGTDVCLTATPGANSTFTDWTGSASCITDPKGLCVGSNTCMLQAVNTDLSKTANFLCDQGYCFSDGSCIVAVCKKADDDYDKNCLKACLVHSKHCP